jgi:hypothetical protein
MVRTLRRWSAFLLGIVLLGTTGCATFLDEAMSSERDWAYITGIGKPHPLVVLRDNADGMVGADGRRRSQAFTEMREPAENGGNLQDQKAYLDILGAAAKTDRDPICRLCAIRALGKYKDPRAARVLEEVFQMPTKPRSKDDLYYIPFNQDFTSLIRKEALVGLEQSHDDDARRLLIQVARQPGPPTTADLTDRQQTQDEKIVAIRALRHYKHPECIETLKYVLRTEKDVALRDRAKDSLDESTGRRWPVEYSAWQQPEVQPLQNNDNIIQTVGAWFWK